MVVVDRFTSRHFIPTVKSISGEGAAKRFIDNIICSMDYPQEIVSDKDFNFLSPFWKTIQAVFWVQN